jgi:hypothetical protein
MENKDKSVHKFSIIHHYLSPNSAVTLEGHTVKRENKIWLDDPPPGRPRFVMCAPYDSHYIYKDPEFDKGTIGKSAFMCTCGSWSCLVGSNAYKQDGSPSSEGTVPGEMLVCFIHASTGRHADGSQ